MMNNQDDALENIAFDVLDRSRQDSSKSKDNRSEYVDAEPYEQPPLSNSLSKPQPASNLSVTSSDMDNQLQKTPLEGEFSIAPRENLQAHKDSLSGWQKFLFNRKVGKLRREEALKISQALFEREFESVMQKLTLSLDIEKKRTFANYVRSTNSLQRELQQLDAAACLSLTQSLMDINMQIYTAQNRNEQFINDLLRQGTINQQQAAQEHRKNQELSERNLDGAMMTLDQMWNNHKKLLEQTLRVSLDDLIVKGKL